MIGHICLSQLSLPVERLGSLHIVLDGDPPGLFHDLPGLGVSLLQVPDGRNQIGPGLYDLRVRFAVFGLGFKSVRAVGLERICIRPKHDSRGDRRGHNHGPQGNSIGHLSSSR